MSRVFGLGYSWPDTYAQCVFQTLLYNIELRQQYDKQQCRHLLEDTDDTDGEEDPILFVPEPDEDSLTQGQTEHQQTADSPYDDEEQQSWLQLQNVSSITVSVVSVVWAVCLLMIQRVTGSAAVKYIMFDINNCTKTNTKSRNVIAGCRDYLLTASP